MARSEDVFQTRSNRKGKQVFVVDLPEGGQVVHVADFKHNRITSYRNEPAQNQQRSGD